MFEAYRGTVDDPGATPADAAGSVRKFFEGGFGPPLLDCSFVALDEGNIVAVTFVCVFEERPLLAQAYTLPSWKNRGLARAYPTFTKDSTLFKSRIVCGVDLILATSPLLSGG